MVVGNLDLSDEAAHHFEHGKALMHRQPTWEATVMRQCGAEGEWGRGGTRKDE